MYGAKITLYSPRDTWGMDAGETMDLWMSAPELDYDRFDSMVEWYLELPAMASERGHEITGTKIFNTKADYFKGFEEAHGFKTWLQKEEEEAE